MVYAVSMEILLVCLMIVGVKLNIKVLRNGCFTLATFMLVLIVADILM